jgi:hypothetical protein
MTSQMKGIRDVTGPINAENPAMSNKGQRDQVCKTGDLARSRVSKGQRGRGVVVTERGPFPAAKGDPKMGVSVPVAALIVYPETLADP